MAHVGLILLDVCVFVLQIQLLLYLKQRTYEFTGLFYLAITICHFLPPL
jgi:hypothetical protein